jgi:hypothetical protein
VVLILSIVSNESIRAAGWVGVVGTFDAGCAVAVVLEKGRAVKTWSTRGDAGRRQKPEVADIHAAGGSLRHMGSDSSHLTQWDSK